MGRIGRLLSFTRRVVNGVTRNEAKGDIGGGEIVTGESVAPPGFDAHPLRGDFEARVRVHKSGRYVVVGYVDATVAPQSEPGESGLYGRDPAGAEVCRLRLRNDGAIEAYNDAISWTLAPDGTATLDNGAGSIVMGSDGTVTINGATFDPDGNFQAPTVKSASNDLDEHGHPYTWTDPAGNGNTGPATTP